MNAIVIPAPKPRRIEPAHRRTLSKVRRKSRIAGAEHGVIWSKVELNKGLVLRAAETFDARLRKQGERRGPLGEVGLEVLRALWRFVDWKTGRLEPAIATIAREIKRSRKAVVGALARLKAHGFLDWVRRYVETDLQGQRGPQVEQTTNAYWLKLPQRALALLGFKHRPAPIPDDERTRKDAMIASLKEAAGEEWLESCRLSPAAAAKMKGDDPQTERG